MKLKLRMTEAQHRELRSLLFRGDGREAVVVMICGRHRGASVHALAVQELHAVAEEDYIVREADRLEWRSRGVIPLLDRARQEGLGLVIAHSHPRGPLAFSPVDDAWDRKLFPSLHGWFDAVEPLCSAVMTSEGKMVARAVMPDGAFVAADVVAVVGDRIRLWGSDDDGVPLPSFVERHERYLGKATTRLLRSLSVGVVGCSGTGTPSIELLARAGVGHLVLADPGRIRDVNLNRSVGTRASEVGEFKVTAKARYLEGLGLGTRVEAFPVDIRRSEDALLALSGCDVLFGCVDSFGGRSVLNRLATSQVIPYFDLGVGLRPSKDGRLKTAQVAMHYLRPGGSSLRSRGFFSSEDLAAEELLERDPGEFRRRVADGYLPGVDEVSPTVASFNFLVASRAVNGLLARLHEGFQARDLRESAVVVDDFRALETHCFEEGGPCEVLAPLVGRGDLEVLRYVQGAAEGEC